MQVNFYEAKTRLSELVDQSHGGDTVIIAKLVPLDGPIKRKIQYGLLKGKFEIPPDFDAPLPDEELALWEGKTAP